MSRPLPGAGPRRSLWSRLSLAVALSMLLGLAVLVGGGKLVQYSYQERLFKGIAGNLATLGAASVSAAVVFEDQRTAAEILDNFALLPSVQAIEVRLRDGRLLASWERPEWQALRRQGLVTLPGITAASGLAAAANGQAVAARAPILVNGEHYGDLFGVLSREILAESGRGALFFAGLAALLALLVALLSARLLQRFIAAPILGMSAAMRRIANEGDYSGSVVYRGNDPLGAMADSFNVMVRRIAEREESLRAARVTAEEGARAKQAFVANMSHELRTPMNVVLGGLHLAAGKANDAELRSLLLTTRQAAESLLGLINDVLDLSKIDAGHAALSEGPVSLGEQLERLRGLLALRARQKQLSFYVSLDPEARCTVVTDGQKLSQILTNLAANAVKYTEAGEVGIEVRCLERRDGEGRFRFLVRDTGIGIEPAVLGRLFDAFYQAESARDKRFQGTGLGLSIAQRLAGLLGTVIQVESEPGIGSSFWFDLTVPVLADTAEADAPAPAPAVPGPAIAGARVLLVDDTRTSRLVMRGLLEAVGLRVVEAGDGYEAVALACGDEQPDLVLMDIQMPGMDGVEASRRIRAWYADRDGSAPPPIIALTAYAYEEDRREFLAAGLDDYLAKPVPPDALYDALARHLKRS